MDLGQIVHDFAVGMEAADHRYPQAASQRDATRLYRPGIGPFGEDAAVAMTLTEMQTAHGDAYAIAGKRRYPSGRYVSDLALGELPEWAIEVKLARLGRDNGTYEDAAIKKILSPYPDDRSAVTDCQKLAVSSFAGRRAVLIYGFEDPDRPLSWLIEAFEAVTARIVSLGPREEAPLNHLVHPVFAAGHVYAWEILTAEVTATSPHIGLRRSTATPDDRGASTQQPYSARADKEEVRGQPPAPDRWRSPPLRTLGEGGRTNTRRCLPSAT